MNNFQNVYNTQEYRLSNGTLRYYFVSKGKKDIIKAVQYQYVRHFDGHPLFNLGFGDFNLAFENQNLIEPYEKGKEYNAVLVMKKNP